MSYIFTGDVGHFFSCLPGASAGVSEGEGSVPSGGGVRRLSFNNFYI